MNLSDFLNLSIYCIPFSWKCSILKVMHKRFAVSETQDYVLTENPGWQCLFLIEKTPVFWRFAAPLLDSIKK